MGYIPSNDCILCCRRPAWPLSFPCCWPPIWPPSAPSMWSSDRVYSIPVKMQYLFACTTSSHFT
ncbi:hypothetical protein B0H17DRAFT_1053183 [Mycena rosella]|uniref:Uncharacterized protein n=1 Tax=Mycena rosella TaxID=1033263 RepID=A0AAD7GLQ7_MYCRO|nr:hypothetical protein B0H17DRAFT_1053183 [Mycena rosella]